MISKIKLLFTFPTLLILWDFSRSVSAEGCSASPLINNQPFVVVWNHPTSACEDHGIHLDFERWGIVDNTRDRFFGQQIALFYNLGRWPYYNKQNQPVNGGIPQLSDLQAHLSKVDSDLKTNVWNKSFSGLGVIDMEQWRPLYWTNFDSKSIYQRQSLALVKQRYPSYNKTQVLAEAIKEFNKAARDFMGQTLQKTTTERPSGKWGYYLFPRCFDPTCNTTTLRNNDRISWLFQGSSGLYPSIYFKLATPPSATALHIKRTLYETFRVKAKYSSQDIPVMPYSKSQEGPYQMYQDTDLSLAVLQPANMGSSGVVIWGSSSEARAKNECLILQDYVNHVLGPYSRKVTNFFGNCTEQLCHGHGRCVRKDYERVYQSHLRDSGRSECLIPDKVLESKGNDEDSNQFGSVSESESKNKKKDYNFKSSQARNKVFTFLNYIKKSLNVKSKWQRCLKADRKSLQFSRSVIKFSVKSNEQRATDSFPPSKEDTGEDCAKDKLTFAPLYDFDDYVCKCFPGFAGNHCESTT